MKAQTLITAHDGKKKLNEGDLVIIIQGNRENGGLQVNMDWSFDKNVSHSEIKSFLGCFLASVDDIWGEKMVTEAFVHYAGDTKKAVKGFDGQTVAFHLKSKGLNFKKGAKNG